MSTTHWKQESKEMEEELTKLRALNLALLKERERFEKTRYEYTTEWGRVGLYLTDSIGHGRHVELFLSTPREFSIERDVYINLMYGTKTLMSLCPEGTLTLIDRRTFHRTQLPRNLALPCLSALKRALDDPPADPKKRALLVQLGPFLDEFIEEAKKILAAREK